MMMVDDDCSSDKSIINNAISIWIANTNETELKKALSLIIEKMKQKPIESVNKILLVCNDYIISKQIPFMHRAMELINELINANASSSIHMSILKYIKTIFKEITCVPLSIKALFKIHQHSKGEDPAILREVFTFITELFTCEKLNLPSYNQETRNYGLKLLLAIIPQYKFNDTDGIKMIGIVIDCIGEERDPRNILLVFALVKIAYEHIPYTIIKPFDKAIYDILIEYYPIDFTPPKKNAPDSITPKDLSMNLNEALSMECFSEFYFNDVNEYSTASIDVFSTLQCITGAYSDEGILKYYNTISDFIINTIMNNSEEDVHIEGLVTYNYFIKRVCLCTGERNALLLRKTFDYLADQLFSMEEMKRSCDAKDCLCVLIEHSNDNLLIQNSFELIAKALSHFLLTKKYFFLLKNVNSLLFFSIKKIDSNMPIPSIIIDNKKLFLILQQLMKELPIDKEVFIIVIIDILSAIGVKFKGVYDNKEIEELIKDIKHIYYGHDNCSIENMNHISYCLSEMIKVYPELDWIDDIIKTMPNKEIMSIRKQDMSLLKAILMWNDNKKQNAIFTFLIDNIHKEEVLIVLQQICIENYNRFQSLFIANAEKINEIIIHNCNSQKYYPFINELLKRNVIIDQQSLLLKIIHNDNNINLNNLIDQYPFIKKIITKAKIDCDSIYDLLVLKYDQVFKEALNCNTTNNAINHRLLITIGKCIYLSIKACTKEKLLVIYSCFAKELESFFNETNQSIILYKEPIVSYHLNALITQYESDSTSKNVFDIISYWLNNFSSLSLTSPIIQSECYYITNLFKIQMPIDIKEMIQIKLKSNHILEKPVLSLMLNIYSKDKTAEADILFILYSKALLNDIQIESSIKQIRRLLINPKQLESFKRGYSNAKDLIGKLIQLVRKDGNSNSMEFKLEALKLIGLLRYCIEANDDYIRSVTVQLKKCLNDKKRQVRQMCGIAITIWNLKE